MRQQLRNGEPRKTLRLTKSDYDYVQFLSAARSKTDTLVMHEIIKDHKEYLKLQAVNNSKV